MFGATQPMTLAEAIQVLQTLSASVFAALEHALWPLASAAPPTAPGAAAPPPVVLLFAA